MDVRLLCAGRQFRPPKTGIFDKIRKIIRSKNSACCNSDPISID